MKSGNTKPQKNGWPASCPNYPAFTSAQDHQHKHKHKKLRSN